MDNFELLYQEVSNEKVDIMKNVSLKEYTTLHIGGAAKLIAKPTSVEEIKLCLKASQAYDVPYFILGNGSNVLVLDEGYAGLIILLSDNFSTLEVVNDTYVRVRSGASIKAVCAYCWLHELTGLEFACGIPGTVGGAIFMNAGAYGGEMSDVVEEVTYLSEDGTVNVLKNDELQFSYRYSIFSEQPGIVLEVLYSLKKGNPTLIKQKMDELMKKRQEKQPLEDYSAGSVFKRPLNNYASALIMESNLQGFQVRDACVSKKHAGFLINKGSASSDDFLTLIQEVKKRVYEDSGYDLMCEIKILAQDRER